MAQQDKDLLFSDGQTITTDETATNTIDLEAGSVVDQQAGPAWLCMKVIAATGLSLTAGLSVHLVTSDATPITAGPENAPGTEKGVVSMSNIPVAELVAGAVFTVGFLMDDLKKHLGIWFDDEGDAVTGTLTLDVWIQDRPITKLKTQKQRS